LRNYIGSHSVARGTKLPDLTTLSEQCGVSLRTAEKALQVLVNDGWCYRRPKRGTFVCGNGTQTRDDTSHRICGIVNFEDGFDLASDRFLGSAYGDIQRQARLANFDLLLLPPTNIDFYYHNRSVNLAGVLLWHWNDWEKVLAATRRYADLPFVVINYDPGFIENSPENVYAVLNDEFAAGYEAGYALTRRGHRQLAAITIRLPDCVYRQRLAGFAQAAIDARVDWSDGCAYTYSEHPAPSEEMNIEIGYSMAKRIVAERPNVTAIFCMNDLMAFGASVYLGEQNLRSKVELMGCDYTIFPHLSRDNHFSTIKVEFDTMWVHAMRFLANPNQYHPKVLRLAPTLIPRWNIEALPGNSIECASTQRPMSLSAASVSLPPVSPAHRWRSPAIRQGENADALS
jgi:DNA-binding LacI/PurR family transcriptional regulator